MENLSPEAIACLGTSIAIDLAKGKSCEEINLLRNLFSQISATLCTISTQKIFLENKCKNKK